MFGSKNDFFYQDIIDLHESKLQAEFILKSLGRSDNDILDYLEAFDYFVANPSDYDGATIVKDLVDIRKGKYYLDLDAMLHDFEYLNGADNKFNIKWKSDWRYIKNMELNGKGLRIFRLTVLSLYGLYTVPRYYITK